MCKISRACEVFPKNSFVTFFIVRFFGESDSSASFCPGVNALPPQKLSTDKPLCADFIPGSGRSLIGCYLSPFIQLDDEPSSASRRSRECFLDSTVMEKERLDGTEGDTT